MTQGALPLGTLGGSFAPCNLGKGRAFAIYLLNVPRSAWGSRARYLNPYALAGGGTEPPA